MAERGVSKAELATGRVRQYRWTGLTPGDTAEEVFLDGAGLLIATMQVEGMSTGTITLQGSNDNGTFYNLSDTENTAISVTADGLVEIRASALAWVKPVLTGGVSDDVTVTIVTRE